MKLMAEEEDRLQITEFLINTIDHKPKVEEYMHMYIYTHTHAYIYMYIYIHTGIYYMLNIYT